MIIQSSEINIQMNYKYLRWNSRSDVTVLLESSGPYVRVQFLLRVRCGGSRLIVVLKKRYGGFAIEFGYEIIDLASEPADDHSAPPEFELVVDNVDAGSFEHFDIDDLPGDEGQPGISSGITSDATTDQATWSSMVPGSFCQFSGLPVEMQFPWEQGIMRDIFNKPRDLKLSMESEDRRVAEPRGHPLDILEHDSELALTAAKAVRNIQDLNYFEDKRQRLELACSTWMDIFVCGMESKQCWFADFQRDASGDLASETLRSEESGYPAQEGSGSEAVLQLALA